MEVVHSRCCGLDVHKKSISACVMIREHGKVEKLERRFGTFTQELEDLAAWLAEHQVTHVVMEATGVYWKPVWNVLEGCFDLMLVNPQHVKALTGKKCDRRDDASDLAESGRSTACCRAVFDFVSGGPAFARSHKESRAYGTRSITDQEPHPEGIGRGERETGQRGHRCLGRIGATHAEGTYRG